MRILDLFSGTGSATAPFADAGWEVERVDILGGIDARDYHPAGVYDFIWASPPCTAFSVAGIHAHHFIGGLPFTDAAFLGLELLRHTRRIISESGSRFFVIENPRGLMRRMDEVADLERVTITYCQYGDSRMKPTDLWGGFPPKFVPRSPCARGNSHPGSTQGRSGAAARGRVPYALGHDLLLSLESP